MSSCHAVCFYSHPCLTWYVSLWHDLYFVGFIVSPELTSFLFLPQVCCGVVEYLPDGTLKSFLIKSRREKLAFKVVIQLALDLARG
ncbi:hypothetical protein RHSIM_Rhsim02G0041800 [Rhododendron simsii]|uniref:Uncharacterized protein n=1 Tax=Rhododendron simsii TaxID=118357 RepID=A0A834HD58_RHOSS|nr:hypothetical protein RHSIM_Rhsim02G0041800 [Rhododendron simsii]